MYQAEGNAVSETKTTNQMLAVVEGKYLYCGGFKWLGLPCSCCAQASVLAFFFSLFKVPCRKCPHVRLDATSQSDPTRRSVAARWFISEGFQGNTVVHRRFHRPSCSPVAAEGWDCTSRPQDGAAGASHEQRRLLWQQQREKTSSHHYHDICKLWWWFSNCECWHAAYCFNYSQTVVPDHAIGKCSKYSMFDLVGSCETGNEWWLTIMMIIMVKGFVPQVIWLHELPYVERALKKGVKKKKAVKISLLCTRSSARGARQVTWDEMIYGQQINLTSRVIRRWQ